MLLPDIGPAVAAAFPEVKSFTRISEAGYMLVRYHDKNMRIGGFVYADNSLFDVLTFKFIRGTEDPIDRPGKAHSHFS